jgi:hypothetical protein
MYTHDFRRASHDNHPYPIQMSLTPQCRYSGYPAGLVEGMESDAGTAVCSDSCFGPRRPAT